MEYEFEEAFFSFRMLETKLNVLVQLLLNWLWCVRILITFVSFTVHCENFVVNHKSNMF